jgi:hypothetical protein
VEDWQKFGWLKAHKTNRNEIAELLAVADRDLGLPGLPAIAVLPGKTACKN